MRRWLARPLRAEELLEALQLVGLGLAMHDDEPIPPLMKPHDAVGPAHERAVEVLRQHQAHIAAAADAAEMLQRRRGWLETYSDALRHDCEIRAVTGPIRGEWVIPPDADPGRRMLYLHGGSFQAGSARSHRTLATRLAEQAGVVVLSLDYRLEPEHSRQDQLDNTDAGWAFLCVEGPDGRADLVDGYVAGDSAGGDLSAGLLQRVRDAGERLPDAAVLLSATLDSTYSSSSCVSNIDSDPMLGPGFGGAISASHALLVLTTWVTTGFRPDDPRVSPLLGGLGALPPMVQVNEAEMLRDDSVRYARAAAAAGSPTRLQVWPTMLHVWQMLPELPEAREALDEIVAFLDQHRAA